jgi:hypothetical protein
MNEDPEDRLNEYKKLAEAILILALKDLNLADNYKQEVNKKSAERHRTSALRFIRSPWFREICNSLGYPHDAVKLAALK